MYSLNHKVKLKQRKDDSERLQREREREEQKKLRQLQRYHARAMKQLLEDIYQNED